MEFKTSPVRKMFEMLVVVSNFILTESNEMKRKNNNRRWGLTLKNLKTWVFKIKRPNQNYHESIDHSVPDDREVWSAGIKKIKNKNLRFL